MHVGLILTTGSRAAGVTHHVCTLVEGAAFCRPFVYALMPHRIALYSGYLHLLSRLTITLLYLIGAKVKRSDGWPVLSHSSIVCHNHLHKVGLDHSLKYQSALLFSFPFEIFFALACVPMVVLLWCATQT